MYIIEQSECCLSVSVGIAGGGGLGGSTPSPQLMSSTPLVVLRCLSWVVRNNHYRSQLQTLYLPSYSTSYRTLSLLSSIRTLQCYYSVAISYQYYKAFMFSHSTYVYCYSVNLLLKWQQNCGAIILYVYCVLH